jgi:segregation and condensation protein B
MSEVGRSDEAWEREVEALKAMLEALLFSATGPVSAEQLAEACEMPLDTTREVLRLLEKEYDSGCRGFSICLVAGGYRMMTRPEHAEAIRRLGREEKQAPPLSRAALEVLAIIAYRQPATRAEIDNIRGVSSDSSLRTLLDRGLIEEAGRKQVIGRPLLYCTTPEFLLRFGLLSLKDLPPFDPEGPLTQ